MKTKFKNEILYGGLTKEEFILGCVKVEKRRMEQLHELRERYLAGIHEVDRIYNSELGQLRTEYTGDASIAKIGDTITDGVKIMKVEDVSIDDRCDICYLGKKMVGRKVVGKEVSGMYEKDIFKVNGIQVPGRESRRKKQTTKRNKK